MKINGKGALPINDGFRMRAEFDRHEGTIMIYPTRSGSWGKDRSGALASFGLIFYEILKREDLYLLVPNDPVFYAEAKEFTDLIARKVCSESGGRLTHAMNLIKMDTDDSWARDVAPIFVSGKDGSKRGVNFGFNAWGGEVDGLYASWDKDNAVPRNFCDFCGYEYYDAEPFILEGGSVHTDGDGTLMVTESCLLSKGRNPSLSKEQIEEKLKAFLGAQKVLWLPRGIYNDETNEHVDNVCAFTKPGEVVLAWTDNKNDPQYELSLASYEYLMNATDAKGRKIKVHKLPIPDVPVLINEDNLANYVFEDGEDERTVGERLAASYVNYYYINGAILVPQFGGANKESDKRTLDILKDIHPDREVIGIPATDILLGGGNIHCITQQIPE